MLIMLSPLLLLFGCEASPDETRTWWQNRLDRIEATQAQVSDEVAALEAALAKFAQDLDDVPDDGEVPDRVRDEAAAAAAVLAKLLAHRDTLSEEIARAKATLDGIPEGATAGEINAKMTGQAVTSVGVVLPPPWNAVLAGAGALIGASGGLFGLIGRRKAAKAEEDAADANEVLESTVAAIETAKRANATLRQGFAETSGLIRTNLSNAAEVRVNEIRTIYGKAA